VKEVTRAVIPGRHPTWLVKIYPGSAGIGFYPRAGGLTADELSQLRHAVLSGIELLEHGQRPAHYTDKAIEHARGIPAAFKARRRPAKLRIWNRNERALPIKPEIQHTAAQLLEPLYEDEGSIEGTLEVLSGHGRLEVVVYDPLDGRAIKCELSPEDMRSALDNFMRRVEVFGKIRYRRDGMAVSVKVDEIIPFPRSEEIPSLDQVRGILRN